jgi:CHAT domain-containing protein
VIANRRERSRNRPRSPNADDRLLLVAAGDPDFAWEEDRSPVEPPQDADEAHRVAVLESSRMRGGFRDLPRLPGTKSEVDAIARLAAAKDEKAAVRVLSGQDSTVTNLFRAADRPRFLHLATHGLAWEARRAHETALAFAAPRVVAPDDIGFLRLSDLLSRWGGRLDGTRLVTLSACRSALGSEETGEGFVALTWGFLYAGADSVVASLWKVDDEATFLLMRRFYANVFSRELPPADALHEAKRWLRGLDRSEAAALLRGAKEVPPARTESADPRRGYAEPFFWGAFVLVGGGG